MREHHRRFVQDRIDLLWRVRAVLVVAREKLRPEGGWSSGREALRLAAKALLAPPTVISESLRLAGLRAEESEGVADNIPEAIAHCTREIRALERELRFAATAADFGKGPGGSTGGLLQ